MEGLAWWCDVGKVDKGCGIESLGWCYASMDLHFGDGEGLGFG
ncbi:hypothetical protein A2U01_0090644, partial [Trifolium medium]|nr:hypothetical protein [Trifolium medium]